MLKRILAVFAIPFLEIVLIHHLNPNDFSFGVNTILPQTAVALFVFLSVIEEKYPIQLIFRRKILIFNLITYGLLLYGTLEMESCVAKCGWPLFATAWFLLTILSIGSGLFVFARLEVIFEAVKKYRPEAFFGLIASISHLLYFTFQKWYWHWMAQLILPLVTGILGIFGIIVKRGAAWNELQHSSFSVTIAPLCSGLEGIFFFIFIFMIIAMLERKRYSKVALGGIFLGGILLMFFLNVMRIAAFFMFAVWVKQKWGDQAAVKWILWGFHSNVGWILYLVGIIALFAGVFWWRNSTFYRKNSATKESHPKAQ